MHLKLSRHQSQYSKLPSSKYVALESDTHSTRNRIPQSTRKGEHANMAASETENKEYQDDDRNYSINFNDSTNLGSLGSLTAKPLYTRPSHNPFAKQT